MQTGYTIIRLFSPFTLCAMDSNYLLAFDVFIVLVVLSLLRTFLRSRKTLSLPPGPNGLPLVGNIIDMPTEKEWLTFSRWGEIYGASYFNYPLMYVHKLQ